MASHYEPDVPSEAGYESIHIASDGPGHPPDTEEDEINSEEPEGYYTRKHEVLRIPPEIWPALEARLRAQGNFVVAWLDALCASFPERTLMDLVREGDPRLFPPCLRTKETLRSIRGHLILTDNDVVVVRDNLPGQSMEDWKARQAREASRAIELAAFRACRFQEGFASEGMLCNEPPIPLRVLDFLETQDLVNLSLVCKSAHQAAHLLFKREEAVAARIRLSHHRPNVPEDCSERAIRLESLMLGTPEAIPVTPCRRPYLRQNSAVQMPLRSAAWRPGWYVEDRITDGLSAFMQYMQDASARTFCPPDASYGEHMYVIEAPHLQGLQAQLVDLPETKWRNIDMLRQMFSLVNGAAEMLEPLLLRSYRVQSKPYLYRYQQFEAPYESRSPFRTGWL